MPQDKSNTFNRPLPLNQNERLRDSLVAPKYNANPNNPSFPSTSDGIVPSSLQPQKSTSTKKPNNRGQITRRDDDNTKDIYIGIQDHDEAIAYYFNNVIKPSVIVNGDRVSIPLIYGSPERWKGVQKDGYFRDKEGKIQTPVIMFKRDSVEKRRDLGNKMDANNPHLYQTFQIKYTKKNQYDNFSALQNRIPQREFHNVIIPDYVKLKYSFIVWTDFVAQNNKIVEAINYASDSYWGNPERFKFMARIDTFSNSVEVAQGSNRMVKTTFGLDLQGYIIPDAMNAHLSSQPKKHFSKSTVAFGTEYVSTFDKTKTREQIREEAGHQNIQQVGTGIGYSTIGQNNQIG
jgi:hypothetical protein